jgi:hypothetical protein
MNTRRFVSLIIFLATLFALPLLPVSIGTANDRFGSFATEPFRANADQCPLCTQ